MRETIIKTDTEKCEGCNRCVRVCPVDEANIAYMDGEKVRVRVDPEKCILCGACLKVCQHEARSYIDDTERFFRDLEKGTKIVLIAAPALRTNYQNWESLLAWLKNRGVLKIFDVSLGADICTWAHIRYIKEKDPPPIITQPCPAIVGYIEKYRPELVRNLSPVHSPMLCTAIFAREHLESDCRIAALSPCVAKKAEFDDTNVIEYNVTFKKLSEYIGKKGIRIPDSEFQFDHISSSLGRIYPMPGGLKENIEFYLGKAIRVDKSEGQSRVYRDIDKFAFEDEENLPAVFDVLNCEEGCNNGTGCSNECSVFSINAGMDEQRHIGMEKYEKRSADEYTILFSLFDKELSIDSFIRRYKGSPQRAISYTDEGLERAFLSLGKTSLEQRNHNCFSCGNETCREMAVKIAKGINVPENCVEKARCEILAAQEAFLNEKSKSRDNIQNISGEIEEIRRLFNNVLTKIKNIEDAIEKYNAMAKLVNDIAMQTRILSINASIEASRSGAAGKGFGVIAQAIRDLASRSQNSVGEVEETSGYAKATINVIKNSGGDVDQSIEKVSSYLSQIAYSNDG